MKYIKKLVDCIDDELYSARNYAEKYVASKAKNDTKWAGRYKEMANDELRHATYLHDLATEEIERLSATMVPPEDMVEKWERGHAKYVEKEALIKTMLSM